MPMKLRTAVLISLLLGLAGALLGFRFLEPIPVPIAVLGILDAAVLGRLCSAVLAGTAVYGACAASLIGSGMTMEVLAARQSLRAAAAPKRDEHLKTREWEAAFSGLSIEPVQYRIVARSVAFDDDRLLLASPFSAQGARAELRGFYQRRLAVAQVWTLAVGMIIVTALPALSLLPLETAQFLSHLALAADALVLSTLAFSWLSVTAAVEVLVTAISRLPLLLESAARTQSLPALLGNGNAAMAQLPAAAAAAIRGEAEVLLSRVEKATSHSLATDRELLERLVEGVTAAVFTSVDRRLAGSLKTFEKLSAATRALGEELTARIASLPDALAQLHASERHEMTRLLVEAITADQRALHEAVGGLKQTLTEAAERQVEELRRVGAEARQASTQLAETVSDACFQIEQDRHAGLAKTTQLIESVEAYTASLLPAIKRLETSDERMVRAIGQQDETLSQLSIAVNELSGTLEAARTVLAQARGRSPAPFVPAQDESRPLGAGLAANGDAAQSSLAAQLRALLDDMEDTPTVG